MQSYTYRETLAASERVSWRVEDIIGDDRHLDFTRPFMPESLARTGALAILPAAERLALNHIRGNGYLCLFGLAEEFILPFVIDHVRNSLDADDYRTRALLRFASEEAKHIHLFKRFREEFEDGFETGCDVIGPAQDIARAVLSHSPLGIGLTILHFEWMTQRHYLESVRTDGALDPLFASLLKHHWMEEAQHARLDTLLLQAMTLDMPVEEIDRGVDDYVTIVAYLDGGLRHQVELDIEALGRAAGRVVTDTERGALREQQHQAQRWAFLGSGMTHPNFMGTVGAMLPRARERIERIAPTYC
jgi:hypothetical protein